MITWLWLLGGAVLVYYLVGGGEPSELGRNWKRPGNVSGISEAVGAGTDGLRS